MLAPRSCACDCVPDGTAPVTTPVNLSLEREPFDFQETKDGRVFLFFEGRRVETLTGTDAARFLARVESMNAPEAQLLMARATKNFKRGNERLGKERRKR